MTDTAMLEAQLNDLQGSDRIDALNEVARRLLHHDPSRGLQLSTEAHALALQLRDPLRTAYSLLSLSVLQLKSTEKPGDLNLISALEALMAVQREHNDLKRQLHEYALTVTRHAQEDTLTGVHNRRHFMETFALEYARTRRFNYPLSVALLDIDQLGRINATHSHATGDEVLRVVGQILTRHARETDILARYSGEEFALLLHGAGADTAVVLCDRLRVAVEQYDWNRLKRGLHVTLSIGVADDTTPGGPERMLAMAEQKLMQAKGLGRNCVGS